jgi:hypothetical protein
MVSSQARRVASARTARLIMVVLPAASYSTAADEC